MNTCVYPVSVFTHVCMRVSVHTGGRQSPADAQGHPSVRGGSPRGAHLATLGASSSTTVLSGCTQSGALGESALAGPVSGSEPVSGLSTPSPRPCLQFETPALLRSQVTPGDLVSKDAEGQGRKPKVLSESWPEIWTSAWRSRSLSNHPPQPAASRPGLSASRAARPRPGCTWGWCLDFPVGFRFTCVGSARSAEQRHQEGPQRPSPTAPPTSCLYSQEPQLGAENLAFATLPSTSLLDLRPQADRAPLTKAGLSSPFPGWSLLELYWHWKEYPRLPTSRHFSTNPQKAPASERCQETVQPELCSCGTGASDPREDPRASI